MLKFKTKGLNIDAVLKIIILIGFSLYFNKIINDGSIKLFVHPRIVPYLKFGIIIMLIMTLFLIKDVFNRHRSEGNKLKYVVFIIPLIMAFTLPAKEVNLGTASFNNNVIESSDNKNFSTLESIQSDRNVIDNTLTNDTQTHIAHSKSQNDNDNCEHSLDENYISENMDKSSTLILKDNSIIMDENNFAKCVEEISNNPLKYVGKEIIVTGFVFKDNQFNSDEFVPARMMMTCCAADMSVIGILARYSHASELKDNTWFKFNGTLASNEVEGKCTPIINIKSVEKIKTPQNEYVYPY